jgi:hypothetical protein
MFILWVNPPNFHAQSNLKGCELLDKTSKKLHKAGESLKDRQEPAINE